MEMNNDKSRCPKCNSRDIKVESGMTSNKRKVIATYCNRCREEVRVALDPNQRTSI